uniref:Protein kinase domain-containing protein n=1 Tax=Setaria italica TaxID=4555 RepID=K3ZLW6_SETIT
MADIALGSVERVVKVALAIKTAVETAEQNKKDCLDIGKLAAQVISQTERLKEKTVDPAMRDALEAMADCLNDALLLIAKCHGKCFLLRYLKASDMSKQLRRAHDEISNKMLLGILAIGVDTNIALAQRTQLEAATNDFSKDSYDKRGYYKGVLLHNGLDVVAAIKKISVSNDLELQHELSIRAKLQHGNIVKLLGYAKVEERLCFLVEEYMPNAKSLESIINGMSPKKIRQANVSLKSDVFSFGVILFEIITGRRVSPFDDLPEWSSIEMIRSVKGLFDPALADESQLMKINMCREVGLKCIEWDPKCRPTMADVLEMLNS